MNHLLSLFDKTEYWPEPFIGNGWRVTSVDIQHGFDVMMFDSVETTLDLLETVDGIMSAVPCTHFTNSCAWCWEDKDRDGRTYKALELVYQTLRLVDLFRPTDPDYFGSSNETFFWAIENPVGRLPQLVPVLGDPWYFDPWEYAGHLDLSDSDHNELDRIRRKDAKGVSMEEAMFVMECNAYTKKTGLWGEFNRNIPKAPIEPVRCCKQGSPLQMLGGDSQKTKNIRSATPQGFAKAFYQANKDYQPREAGNFYEIYRKFNKKSIEKYVEKGEQMRNRIQPPQQESQLSLGFGETTRKRKVA